MGRIYTRPEFLLLIFLAGAVKLDGVKAISAQAVEFAAEVRPVVVAIMKEVQEATVELLCFVATAYRAIEQWFAGEEQTSHERDDQARSIVTIRSGRSYEAIKDAIGIDNDSPLTEWYRKQSESLPTPLRFIRHYAVCLVPEATWTDETTELLHKFQHGSFFELTGPNMVDKEGDAVCWGEEKVRSIDGIVEIGLVSYDSETISERSWGRYDTIWWNCSAFAIRLACMILPDLDQKELLRRLLLFVCESRLRTLEFAMSDSHGDICLKSLASGLVSWVGVAGSALLTGAAPVVLMTAFMGSGAFALGSTCLCIWRASRVGAKEYPKWKARS
ncbi:hypothetical protein ASPBRDRAFT_76971 [Aspergillus brasiliensis CBS 101740]|uniref:Ig-like domain-containing protein n=1 Tax=Aspergillus brasiliensis (strain CBS 101740 / IMI 381727 / IBT 21946) TaxID=767769 RepID=A0A1L9UCV9_ASPBC|nr:hypothetical protein ASPBRDRAFT_76971 [Aspergillus brasiliensis CBS 101740]